MHIQLANVRKSIGINKEIKKMKAFDVQIKRESYLLQK